MSRQKKARQCKAASFLVVMFLYFAPTGNAHIPDESIRQIAREAVWSSTHSAGSFLSVHRREDLEDIFYSVRYFRDGIFQRDPQILEVSDAGYEFKNNTVNSHIDIHGPSVYFVAVASESGDTFRIGGFKDSQQEFNRLARSYEVKLSNEFQAQEFASLYMRLDPVNLRLVQTPSLLQLKQLAESRFDDDYKNFALAELSFDRWWSKQQGALARLSLGLKTVATDVGFVASFLTLSGIDRKASANGPAVLRVAIALSKDGQIAEPTLTPVKLQ
jgi:hypothetical protein